MEYRQLGNSGLMVAELCFGAWDVWREKRVSQRLWCER
jgi:aryl-alcohol dehydrogenase-like predicted oxidoreductase